MKIILIGKAGSGKDTVALYLAGAYGFYQYAFADKLKEIARDLFPIEYKDNRRKLLQELGAKLREMKMSVWVDYVLDAVEDERAVISDCRYENEYKVALDHEFIPVGIDCDTMTRNNRLCSRDGRYMTTAEMMHESEQLNVKCDYRLDNNGGFEELYKQIDEVIFKISEGIS